MERARTLRHNQPEPEKRLWQKLRNRQLADVKFRRQKPVGPYIVDFIAIERGLIVEVDGDTHAFSQSGDAERTAYLKNKGFQVIRFTNAEVMENIEGVLQRIMACAGLPSPSQASGLGPSLSLKGEG